MFDLIENYYKIESLESNFKESIVAIIEKLDRHYIHIGQSTLIGEMIIDYSQYIKKNEMKIVNSLGKEIVSLLLNPMIFWDNERRKRELSDIIQTEFKKRRNIAYRYLGL